MSERRKAGAIGDTAGETKSEARRPTGLTFVQPPAFEAQRRMLVRPRVMTAAAMACMMTSTAIWALDTPSTVGM